MFLPSVEEYHTLLAQMIPTVGLLHPRPSYAVHPWEKGPHSTPFLFVEPAPVSSMQADKALAYLGGNEVAFVYEQLRQASQPFWMWDERLGASLLDRSMLSELQQSIAEPKHQEEDTATPDETMQAEVEETWFEEPASVLWWTLTPPLVSSDRSKVIVWAQLCGLYGAAELSWQREWMSGWKKR